MGVSGESGEYRVRLWRRLGFVVVGVLFLVVGLVRWWIAGDDVLIRACVLLVPGSLFLAAYLHWILLKFDDRGISLRWPFQRERFLKWDEISQVRRSDAPPGRNFFIDLMASPDHCIQFNPFLFDRPYDIIRDLNRYLNFDLLEESPRKSDILSEEIAVTAPQPAGPARAHWLLIIVLGAILLLIFLFSIYKVPR